MAKEAGFWATRALIAAVGIMGLAWIYYAAIAAVPPITWHGSSVYPEVVQAGGRIDVTRRFTVHREAIIDVQRKLVKGDCSRECLQYDLNSSTSTIYPGEYNRTLPHNIPASVEPGRYVLLFEIHWQNAVGYRYSIRHPPLSIEVVR